MTFTQIYAEICQRAGQGYSNFTDRAKSAFWRSVGDIIRSGEFAAEEARGITHTSESEAYLLNEFPYSLATQTPITLHHVFEMMAALQPGEPDTVQYTKLDHQTLFRGKTLRYLSQQAGIKEVFYSLKYPNIELIYDTADGVLAAAWCYVYLTWWGIPRAFVESSTNDATENAQYMADSFVSRAIELATKSMAQET